MSKNNNLNHQITKQPNNQTTKQPNNQSPKRSTRYLMIVSLVASEIFKGAI